MKCKRCHTEILNKEFGKRDFCSDECKAEHRKSYLRSKAQKTRKLKKTKVSTNTSVVYKIKPTTATICDPSKSESETLYEDFGGKSWYSLAKKDCCNFEVRVKEGYCAPLAEPYQGFSCKCSDCELGKALMNKAKETKKKKDNSCITRRSMN